MQLPQDQNHISGNRTEDKPDNLWDILKKFWAPITGFIGAVVTVVQFIDLLQGNRDTVSLVTATLGITAIIVSLIFVGFSKIPSPIFSSRQIPRYPNY
jgi:hypothetical protein